MRLIKVGVSGYRRIRSRQEMDVDGKLIAIVGPNEAGKTSLLKALASHLNGSSTFQSREFTRNQPNAQASVWARFALEDEDLRLVAEHVPEAKGLRQVVLSKISSHQSLIWDLEPYPTRDLAPRQHLAKTIDRALSSKWLSTTDDDDGTLTRALTRAREVVDSDKETLVSDEEGVGLDVLKQLVSTLSPYELPKAFKRLVQHTEQTLAHELRPVPELAVIDVLSKYVPQFLFFDDANRNLRSSYSLDEEPNSALHNFLALAGTSWAELTQALDDPGKMTALEERADQLLDIAFESWQQSRLIVRLRVRDRIIQVQVRMHTAHDYVGIEERSDGLRQFIALRAYVKSKDVGTPPILLIDEAESHLHYDAQADLIDVMSEQQDAAKVIYSTHSAACLPPDLGTGVRTVVPIRADDGDGNLRDSDDSDDSEIINWFWTVPGGGGTGFTPLLLGMGAGAFAFASTRRAIIAEGASDAILLPTLLREASESLELDFQIAPGLSNVTREAVADLDLVAGRVAYVLDRDDGGRARKKMLEDAGIPSRRILFLLGSSGDLTLEDLVKPGVYINAVNRALREWYDDAPQISSSALPASKRHGAVERWCMQQGRGLRAPGKRAIAHAIVEQRHQGPLIATNRRAGLRRLHEKLSQLLAEPGH